MERFAINILHKRIHKICRLCGVDQPHKVPIIDGAETIIVGDEDEEASLAKKIEECVGIQVFKDDKMPQNICSLCVDKINDFYEYRLMCAATNLQTRTILNLNLVEPKRKLLNFGGEPPKVEPSVKEEEKKDVKKVVEVATSSSSSISPSAAKKGKKRRGPPSPSPSPAPTTRIKAAVDVKDEPVPTVPVKALTKKERLKQLQLQKEKDEKKKKEADKKNRKEDKHKKEKVEEKPVEVTEQKHTRSKRKEPSPAKEVVEKVEPTVPPPKKIKFEHPCSYCSDEFKTQTELDGHLGLKHTPTIRKFGCGSCRETFETVLESKDHNLWHQLTRTLYTCFKCKRKYDKNMALVKHMALNACGRIARGRPPTILPDIQCRLCNKKFKTQHLYEWHACFLKPKANCPKCGKYFVKKQILTRHYMLFCTGTLPRPEPVIVPKAEPIDPAEKPAAGSSGAANPERRTRRAAVVEPDLPKEEREIPFPPPLELAPEAPAAPSGSKKKNSRKEKEAAPEPTPKPATPAVESGKFASLLTSGAKLDRDTDIATINNLLSSVTEAIASISEAKAKKKKKRKDKNKDRAPTEVESPTVEAPVVEAPAVEPPAVEEPAVEKPAVEEPAVEAPAVETPEEIPLETPPPTEQTPSPVVDDKTEEELQAYELAQEVGGMTLDQQLAFCSDKLPMVVLAKTTFKLECTEIDTEPSQLQEPMDEDDADQTVENGEEEDNGYEDTINDYSGFQEDDDDQQEPAPEEEAPSPPTEAPAEQENQQTEELPFPMPIKQEIDPEEPEATTEAPQQEEPSATTEAPQQGESQPPVEVPKEPEKDPPFDEQLAINIKKEPGLEEDLQSAPAAKRKRPESRSSAAASPASSLSSSQSTAQSSPKPTLILTIKKEKGLLNSSVAPVREIRTIVLDDDDDEEEAEAVHRTQESEPEKAKKRVYKKPENLAVRIKQEKVDPAYERQEQIVVNLAELPGGIRVKQEQLDPDEEPIRVDDEEEEVPPPLKKSRSTHKETPASPIIAFDGVRIKQEKSYAIEPVETLSSINKPSVVPAEDPKPPEKRKKSKVKINPFALLRQKMAAEAAANSAAAKSAPPQAPSPLPVITNVVGNASAQSTSSSSNSSSGENTPTVESEPEHERTVPVIAQVTSIAAEKAEIPITIKQEPMDELPEPAEGEQQQEEEEKQAENPAVDNDFPLPIKEEMPEETPASDESPGDASGESPGAASDESPEEPEEPEFPLPIKEELDESQHGEANGSAEASEKEEPEENEVAVEEHVTEKEPTSAETEKEDQNDAEDQHEEEMGEQEEESQPIPMESENPSLAETEKENESEKEDQNEAEKETGEQEEESQQMLKESENPSHAETEKENESEKEDQIEAEKETGEQEEESQQMPKESENPSHAETVKEKEDQIEAEVRNEEESQQMTKESENPSLAETEKEHQAEADDRNEEETGEQEAESQQIPKESENPSHAETGKVNNDEIEEKEEFADQEKDAGLSNEQEFPNQNQPESIDEPQNCTSPISDISMDEYDQNSPGQEPLEDVVESAAVSNEPSEAREPATESEMYDANNETIEKLAEVAPQFPDHQSNLPAESTNVEQSLPSEPSAVEHTSPVAESSITANQSTPLESDLEELQNLLTEGLKPLPGQDYDSPKHPLDGSSSTASGEQNLIQHSSTVFSVGNNSGISGLDDDLESLLNNKLEEISDQFRQPAPPQQLIVAAPQEDDINLAIERELLHEIMPVGTDNGLRTELNQMPNSTASGHSNNSLLEVEQDLLLDGTTGD